MAKPSCKCKEVECEECPEWIFTLADLIMCMMGLFVILWVLKPGEQPKPGSSAADKQNAVVGAIREGFGYVPDPNSTDPIDIMLLDKLEHRLKMNGPGEKGRSRSQTDGAEGTDLSVTTIRAGRQSTVGGRILFDKGDAKLTREAF